MSTIRANKQFILLSVIVLAGIIVRILKFDNPDLVMDSVVYSRLGKNLIEYGRYAFGENYNMGIFFPPGYPVLVGLLNLFLDDLFFSAKMVSFIVSCFSIVLSYLIGRELYDEKSGLFAAFLFAVYPVVILVSVQGYSDAPFIFFMLLSIYLFIQSIKTDKIMIYLLMAVSFTMTFLVRPEGIFILLLPLLQSSGVFGEKLHFNKKYFIKTVFVLMIFVLLISPYMVFIKNYTGKFSLSGKSNVSMILGEFGGENDYHKILNGPGNLYDRAAFTLNENKTQLRGWGKDINFSMTGYIIDDPLAFIKKYQKNVLKEIQVLVKLLIPVVLPLFFSFFYRDLFRDKRRLIFIFFALLFFLLYPVFIIIEKQIFLVVVFLLVFASGGFSRCDIVVRDLSSYYSLNRKLANFIEKNIKLFIIIILIITSLSYLKYSRFQHFDPANAKPEEHKRAALSLIDKVTPEYESINIMARKPYVSYYTGARFTMLPYSNSADVLNFARLYKVDYIVIDERSLSMWEYYGELINLDKLYNNVELVYEENTNKLIKLFKINRG